MRIGKATKEIKALELSAEAQNYLSLLPELLLSAQKIATTLTAGRHNARNGGVGEDFWQFRPYVSGAPVSMIDWRRSAREDTLYLREYEATTTKTLFLWVDNSPSMHFLSHFSSRSKIMHALLLAFILGEIAVKTGERVAMPELLPPTHKRAISEKMALAFLSAKKKIPLQALKKLPPSCDAVLLSDFLDEGDLPSLHQLAQQKRQLYLLEVHDPAEENFPYQGYVEFTDPETGEVLQKSKAQSLKQEYKKLFLERREKLKFYCQRQGWFYTSISTHQSIEQSLLPLSQFLFAKR